MFNFEKILDEIGDFGVYQKFALFLLQVINSYTGVIYSFIEHFEVSILDSFFLTELHLTRWFLSFDQDICTTVRSKCYLYLWNSKTVCLTAISLFNAASRENSNHAVNVRTVSQCLDLIWKKEDVKVLIWNIKKISQVWLYLSISVNLYHWTFWY